jgi:hypothetical protein
MQDNNLTAVPMNHSHMPRMIQKHMETKVPMFIWSPPGCGKTAIVEAICEQFGWRLIDLRLAQMDTVDVRGIPFIFEGRTYYAAPGALPPEDGSWGPCIIFLDEYMQARQDVAAVSGQLVNERRLGDYHLPDNVLIMAASNRAGDRAASGRMPTQIANRFLHYELVVRPTEWCDWATANGIDDRVVAFIRFRPELVYQFDPKATAPAYPTLRTWEKVSTMIKGEASSDVEYIRRVTYAAVGEGAGAEFVGFVTALENLPDIDAIIADPDAHDDPERPDLRFAVAAALGRRADQGNVESIWSYLLKLPAEWQVLWSKDVVSLGDFDLTQHPVYNEIISLHRDILTA